jgi:hypothetical protein
LVDHARAWADDAGMTSKTHLVDLSHGITRAEWRLRMAQLCAACADADAEDEGSMLDRAAALMALEPALATGHADHLPPRARMQALLQLGAHDSAAMALVPEGASWLISQSGDGGSIASVLLPGMAEELTAQAPSPALALVAALSAALASLEGDAAGEFALRDGAMAEEDDVGAREAGADWASWQRPAGAALH